MAPKFDRHLSSAVAEVPAEIQSDTIIITSNLMASRLGSKTSYHLVNRGPDVCS